MRPFIQSVSHVGRVGRDLRSVVVRGMAYPHRRLMLDISAHSHARVAVCNALRRSSCFSAYSRPIRVAQSSPIWRHGCRLRCCATGAHGPHVARDELVDFHSRLAPPSHRAGIPAVSTASAQHGARRYSEAHLARFQIRDRDQPADQLFGVTGADPRETWRTSPPRGRG